MTKDRIDRRTVLAAGLGVSVLATSARAQQPSAGPAAPAISRNLPDVAVVGAGAFGGWAALVLRERGAKVTVVDEYGAGNPRASSGDEARLMRAAYEDRAFYSQWATRAWDQWKAREEEFGRRLLYPNGTLHQQSAAPLAAQKAVFDQLRLPYEVLTADEVAKRWPQVRFETDKAIFYEPRSGILRARETMIAVSETFARKGGSIQVGQASPGRGAGGKLLDLAIKPSGSIAAGAFVFACGPWLPTVFPAFMGDLIERRRAETFYVGSPPGDPSFRWEHLPNLSDAYAYTASDADYGYKVAPPLAVTQMDPDRGDRMPTEFLRAAVEDFVKRRLPGLAGQPIVATRVCQTEMTQNRHYIVDRHPEFDNVLIAGGGSGHAFKMGPVLGDYVADRVLGVRTDPTADALFSLKGRKPVSIIPARSV